jgi:hypothetical protein
MIESSNDQQRVVDAIYAVFDELNLTRTVEQQLPKSLHTPLFGIGGRLDSLGLVSLVVSVEIKIQEQLGATVSLTGDDAMSRPDEVFKDVDSLARYVAALCEAPTR